MKKRILFWLMKKVWKIKLEELHNNNYLAIFPNGDVAGIHWTNNDKKEFAQDKMYWLPRSEWENIAIFECIGDGEELFPKWAKLKDSK